MGERVLVKPRSDGSLDVIIEDGGVQRAVHVTTYADVVKLLSPEQVLQIMSHLSPETD